jgi:hypothetical protein
MYYNKYANEVGGVAHLGERLTGSQEVKGSIPFISTKLKKLIRNGEFFLFLIYSVIPNKKTIALF